MPRSRSLQRALDLEEPGEFMRALVLLDPQHGVRFEERRMPLGMIAGLGALYGGVQAGGIRQFLDARDGSCFEHARRWCREIGAGRAEEYLDAVAALFPEATVPQDDALRFEIAVGHEHEVSPAGGVDPFANLDRAHAGAMDDMAERLRAYAREHAEEIEVALRETQPSRGRSRKAERQLAEEAVGTLQRRLQELANADAARKLAAPRKRARRPDGREDPRIAVFVDALAELSLDQWRRISSSFLAKPRAVNKAREEVASTLADAVAGRLFPRKYYQLMADPALRARNRAIPVIESLPASVTVDGTPLHLREVAAEALLHAWQVLMLYDWLRESHEGTLAARTLLAPFAGFVPLPSDQ